MAAQYQDTDWRIADYETFLLDPSILDADGAALRLRGPRPASLEPGSFIACLGAAQTFGRFCARPFPLLLQERLGLPVLNISRGGAGPGYFDPRRRNLLPYLSRARLVVVQVMSGRSAGNSLFESDGLNTYRNREDGRFMGCDEAFGELMRAGDDGRLRRLVEETRADWLRSYEALLGQIEAPKVLFWFAPRKPGYTERYTSLPKLFGGFPQLVNADMVERLRGLCDAFVACRSTSGRPQRLKDRFTGQPVEIHDPWTPSPWRRNWYYPTPEMHVDAADGLEPGCRALLEMEPSRRPLGPNGGLIGQIAAAIRRKLAMP